MGASMTAEFDTAENVEIEIRQFARAQGLNPVNGDGEMSPAELNSVVSPLSAGRVDERQAFEVASRFQGALFDAGLAWLDGPEEFGGRDLLPAQAADLRDIFGEYELPDLTFFTVAHRIVIPTILAHGSPEQRERWIRPLLRGEILACQLFSEPDAGSDLASLRLSAVRSGSEWILNGQKIWTSWAHMSQVGELLARTGSLADRHRAITAFLVPMDLEGITVRPIRQMTGGFHFNEVFFDDVRVPDSARLGEIDSGWTVAMATLSSERAAMGERSKRYISEPYRRLRTIADLECIAQEATVQELLSEAWIREQLAVVTANRVSSKGDDALSPSIGKLALVDDLEFFGQSAIRLLGPALAVNDGRPGTFAWSDFILSSTAQRIAGGADQIQRNIVAERVLGLPR
jgi:alkylation response protein AidB-like acyl-CoA dehydrogenase